MKKILFVITKSNWGGAQRYVFDMATNLPKDTFDVAVALGGTGEKNAYRGILDERLRAQSVRTVFIPSFMRDVSFFKEWHALRELIRLLRAERPDIVHLNSSKAGALGSLAARIVGIKKIIFTSHGLAWHEDRNILWRTCVWLASWATFLLCHQIIVLSKDTMHSARNLPFCARKIHLIYNGIAASNFTSKEEARFQLSTSMRPPSDVVWIGAIGELTRNKGFEYLIRAAGILKRQEKKFLLYIIGAGEEEKNLHNLIKREYVEDCVYLLGFIPQGWKLLKAFDIFTLTSVKEGFPYVLLEAGLSALPVVASSVGGIPDVIEDTVTGLLVKQPKNPKEIASKLSNCMEHHTLSMKLGNALKEKVEKTFSLETMIKKTVALYTH